MAKSGGGSHRPILPSARIVITSVYFPDKFPVIPGFVFLPDLYPEISGSVILKNRKFPVFYSFREKSPSGNIVLICYFTEGNIIIC